MSALTVDTRTIVLSCPRCGQCHDVVVTLREGCSDRCQQSPPHDAPELCFRLQEYCPCGESLATPANWRDVEDTAERLFSEGAE